MQCLDCGHFSILDTTCHTRAFTEMYIALMLEKNNTPIEKVSL